MKTKEENKVVRLNKDLELRLSKLRKIYHTLTGEKISFENFTHFVLIRGMQTMLRESVPEGQEWNTVMVLFSQNPAFVCDLIREIYKRGSKKEKKQMKKQMKDSIRYIG